MNRLKDRLSSAGETVRRAAERVRTTASACFETLVTRPDGAKLSGGSRGIINEVRLVGAGLVMTLVLTLVLTEVYAAVDFETGPNGSYTGPFGEVVTALESTGVAALSLLVVGFLVVGATAIMRYFGGGFGGGR